MARLAYNYGVVYLSCPQRPNLSQVKAGVVEDGAVLVLVAADYQRQIVFSEKIAENQPHRLLSATPANVLLADGETMVNLQHAGCGCGSPLKAMDVSAVYEENR